MDTKVRFGVIGTNKISHNFVEAAMAVDGFELTAVYSRKEETAKDFASAYGVTNVFTDLEELSKSPLIDAIYIASPNSFHCSQALLFLKNKKHVLCEKAFASNAREAREMIETARENNVLIMEAMRNTVVPNFLALKANLYKLGKIRKVFMSKCQYSSRYDSYKNGVVLNAFKKELSNGALMDIGVYCVHPVVALLGKPQEVIATSVMLESGVDGQGTAILKYDGMDVTIIYSKISDSRLPVEIQGEEGTLTASEVYDFKDVSIKYRNGKEEILSRKHEHENMYYEIKEFVSLVQEGKLESSLNSHEKTILSLEIMDEIRRQIGLQYPADL